MIFVKNVFTYPLIEDWILILSAIDSWRSCLNSALATIFFIKVAVSFADVDQVQSLTKLEHV